MTLTEQRIQGSFYGLAWGDILGCPIETWNKHEITSVFGKYETLPKKYPMDLISSRRRSRLRPLGLHSDDTQQAMALIQVCSGGQRWDLSQWSWILVEGAKAKAWRGVGRNYVDAVRNMSKGISVQQAGSSSSGMGAAMRVGPLGAIFWRPEQIRKLTRATIESSLATHADQRAAVFAAVISFAVSLFVQGLKAKEVLERTVNYAVEAEEFVEKLASQGWKVDFVGDPLVSKTLQQAQSWIGLSICEMRTKISESALPHLHKGFTRAHPNQGFVLLGGLHALLMACREDLTPQQALTSIVIEGYDTDTVAAIAGSLLGARWGTEWIPLDRFYDANRIAIYAKALTGERELESRELFLQEEAKLTAVEKKF